MNILSFLGRIIMISRPRIWIYTAGSFATGILIGTGSFSSLFRMDLLPLFLWLTLPANLFLYSINDAFDYETDAKNPKKDKFENRASKTEKSTLILTGIISCLPLIFIFLGLQFEVKAMIFLWFILVLSYNFPGIRLKAVPILDNLFCFNFPLWGIIGYFLVSGQLPSAQVYVLIGLFSIAMHLYTSSIDLEYDRAAGIKTTSVLIGSVKANLLVCAGSILLLTAGLITMGQLLAAFAVFEYLIFFLVQFFKRGDVKLVHWYRYFIYLHYVTGFIFAINFVKI